MERVALLLEPAGGAEPSGRWVVAMVRKTPPAPTLSARWLIEQKQHSGCKKNPELLFNCGL